MSPNLSLETINLLSLVKATVLRDQKTVILQLQIFFSDIPDGSVSTIIVVIFILEEIYNSFTDKFTAVLVKLYCSSKICYEITFKSQ